jgi:dephospho-CoA kinase
MRIIGITGFSAAGKSMIVDYFRTRYNFPVIRTGDSVRQYIRDKGIPLSANACTALSNKFRRNKKSLGELAKERLLELRESGTECVVIDALRGKYDLDFYRQFSEEIITIGIFSSPQQRFARMLKRSREGDYTNYEDFRKADDWQFNFGVGKLFAFADYMIVAQDRTMEEMYEETDRIIKKIMKQNGK